jgi:hypothetical protein
LQQLAALINGRNVLDFLYPRGRSHAEDIVADEFTNGRWSAERTPATDVRLAGHPLSIMRRRLDTELAHLSYNRLAPREADDQLWRYAAPLAIDLLALADQFIRTLIEPERSWFGPIADGDRVWLIRSMLPPEL